MPELPEVETVRRGLLECILGSHLIDIDTVWGKSLTARGSLSGVRTTSTDLIGESIQDIRRFGKLLVFDFSSEISMMAHLKMTGQLVYRPPSPEQSFGGGHPTPSLVSNLPDNSTRVVFTFSDNSKLFFNDQRKFGYLIVLPTSQVPEDKFVSTLGPDPTHPSFTLTVLKQALSRHPALGIKAALLDQHTVAGIGNIYADEILWRCRLHPLTRCSDISPNKLSRLAKAIPATLQDSIDKGGSTARNYVNATGGRGDYLDTAAVYNKAGQPCQRCGCPIIKIQVAGRGTHICPHCQSHPYRSNRPSHSTKRISIHKNNSLSTRERNPLV